MKRDCSERGTPIRILVYHYTLKLTANSPENGWSEYDCFLLELGWPIFRCELLVSGRVVDNFPSQKETVPGCSREVSAGMATSVVS